MANPGTKPAISVAMCTCNGERYLREQLDTIAGQTRVPLELVVCDDASDDRTIEILEAFASAAPFPVHIHHNHQRLGPTANFDQAMRLCCCEYIALSDQDDCWRPDKIDRLAGVLDRRQDVGMAFSDGTLLGSGSEPLPGSLWRRLRFTPAVRARFVDDPGSVLLQRDVVSGHTMLFRRSLLARFSRIPLSWTHDGWLTWMCVLWSRAFCVAEQLSAYRLHEGQTIGLRADRREGPSARYERIRYVRVAEQFTDLLTYVEETSPALATGLREALERKIAFLLARADAPQSRLERALFILQHARSYSQFARGWRSMSKDCLLGPPGAG